MPGAQDRPMRRDVHQIFLQENVCFPQVFQQGRGEMQNQGGISITPFKTMKNRY